jgi:cell division septation protein DedD
VKERLTGAIILVALFVLLVPELLTGPVRSAPRANTVASSSEEPPLRSYTIKLADEAHPRSAAVRSGPEQPAPLATAPAPSAGAGAGAASVPPAAEPSPTAPPPAATMSGATHAAPAASAAVPPETTAEGSGTYVVQLGSFASRANADRLARQVRTQGFPVNVSQGTSGHLYRVRVGPARDRAAASELAQQLRARGHGGAIVPQ